MAIWTGFKGYTSRFYRGVDMEKCRIGIKREAKSAFSLRKFNILVDGVEITSIANGGMVKFGIDAGQHEVSIAIGKKVFSTLSVALSSGEDVNIVCQATSTGAKMELTPVDVCGLAESQQPIPVIHVHPAGNGCLVNLVAAFLVLVGIFIFLCAIFDIA